MFIEFINSIFGGLLNVIISVFPPSPFLGVPAVIENFEPLRYINWFFPVTECVQLLGIWILCVAGFYLYMVIARWIKLIGD